MLNDLWGLKLPQQFSLCSWLNVSLQFVFVAVKLLTKTMCSLETSFALRLQSNEDITFDVVLSDQRLFVSVGVLNCSLRRPIIHSAQKVQRIFQKRPLSSRAVDECSIFKYIFERDAR